MFTVYILRSEQLQRYYIGQTDDVNKRLNEHLSKQHFKSFTAKAEDWQIVLTLVCTTRQQARMLEAFLKRMRNSSFYQRLCEDKSMQSDLVNRFAN